MDSRHPAKTFKIKFNRTYFLDFQFHSSSSVVGTPPLSLPQQFPLYWKYKASAATFTRLDKELLLHKHPPPAWGTSLAAASGLWTPTQHGSCRTRRWQRIQCTSLLTWEGVGDWLKTMRAMVQIAWRRLHVQRWCTICTTEAREAPSPSWTTSGGVKSWKPRPWSVIVFIHYSYSLGQLIIIWVDSQLQVYQEIYLLIT